MFNADLFPHWLVPKHVVVEDLNRLAISKRTIVEGKTVKVVYYDAQTPLTQCDAECAQRSTTTTERK